MADARKETRKFGLPNPFLAVRDALTLFRKRQVVTPPVSGVNIKPLASIYRDLGADSSLPVGMLNKYIELNKRPRVTVGTLPPVKLGSNELTTDQKPKFLNMGGHYATLRAAVDTGHIDLNQVAGQIHRRDINLTLAEEAADQKKRDDLLKEKYRE